MQVPRYTYLPLLIPEIKENMVELALDDSLLEKYPEKEWWFEEETPEKGDEEVFASQGVCKWYVHIYLFCIPHSSTIISPRHAHTSLGE